MARGDPARSVFSSRAQPIRPRADAWRSGLGGGPAMAPALAIDLSRIYYSAFRATPRGIDRIELLYARHFLQNWPGPCFGILPTYVGARIFGRARTMRGVEAVEAIWGEA